jgi:hypothetical protein
MISFRGPFIHTIGDLSISPELTFCSLDDEVIKIHLSRCKNFNGYFLNTLFSTIPLLADTFQEWVLKEKYVQKNASNGLNIRRAGSLRPPNPPQAEKAAFSFIINAVFRFENFSMMLTI